MFDVLENADCAGCAIVETDVTQKATPLDSAIISRHYPTGIRLQYTNRS